MSKLIRGVFLALVLCVGLSAAAMAQAPAPQLRGFPTPEAAADAVTAAIRNNDDKAMTAILGSTWHEFAPGGDRDDDEIRAALPQGMGRETRDHSGGPRQGAVRRRHHRLGRTDPDRQAGQ